MEVFLIFLLHSPPFLIWLGEHHLHCVSILNVSPADVSFWCSDGVRKVHVPCCRSVIARGRTMSRAIPSSSSFALVVPDQLRKELPLRHSYALTVLFLPPCLPLSIPLLSWNISWHRLNPAGCARRGRRVSWRARRPSSPSWCGKYSEDSGLDRAAGIPMTADPTPPYYFFLHQI